HYVYLKDDENRLSGVVNLNKLIINEPATPLKNIATTDMITANPDDDQEDVAENIAKYNLLAMPVIDDNKRLLGIVTV
ncbi:CBS domain-containing protein, partial [Vibrio cholerae O1]|nr:CBS domain-containing protein [Vibrio cholerae O1]